MNNIDIGFVARNVKLILDRKKKPGPNPIQQRWEKATPDPRKVAPYFQKIGIDALPENVFRFQPDSLRTKFGVTVPAIIAPVHCNVTGDLQGLYEIYLGPSGNLRSTLVRPKIVLGSRGGSIRLAPAGRRLAICATLETDLAFQELRRIPTWCTLTAQSMIDFVPPPVVEEIVPVLGPDQARLNVHGTAGHCPSQRDAALEFTEEHRVNNCLRFGSSPDPEAAKQMPPFGMVAVLPTSKPVVTDAGRLQ